jgi:hypothetical protein
MDLAFGHPVAPGQGEPGCDRLKVILQPTREAGQLRNPAVGGLGHPGLQVVAPALSDEGQKGLVECIGSRDARLHPAELLDRSARPATASRRGTSG